MCIKSGGCTHANCFCRQRLPAVTLLLLKKAKQSLEQQNLQQMQLQMDRQMQSTACCQPCLCVRLGQWF